MSIQHAIVRENGFGHSYLRATPPSTVWTKRTVLVFVHGASGGAWYWERFLKYFSGEGYRAYAPDLLGHGERYPHPALGTLSINDYVKDMLHFIDNVVNEVGYSDMVIIGHSMGGLIAQLLAAERPLRALALITPAPPGGIRFRKGGGVLIPLKESLMAGINALLGRPVKTSRKTLGKLLSRHSPQEVDEIYAKFTPESTRAGREMLLGEIMIDPEDLKMPRMVIVAGGDRIIHPDVGREIALFYGIKPVEFPRHGHMLIIEEPGWEDVARRCSHWLLLIEAK